MDGRIALIANPAAQNGRGAWAAVEAANYLRAQIGDERFSLLLTERAGHAASLAAGLGEDVCAVIALGGDGIVNEVASGLMERPPSARPALGVVPAGSGNDYAATLGMSSSIQRAVSEILAFRTGRADIGQVNGRYFVETLSFGLDAAIALDTVQRRVRTGKSGTRLYLESAIDQLFHHLDTYDFSLHVLRAAPGLAPISLQDKCYLFAVQLGPTYGGHFRITPKASLDDGLFDLCWASPTLSPKRALAVLLAARFGRHTGNEHVQFERAEKLALSFDREPPAQIDGEKIEGTSFCIECIPHALTVILGK